MTPDNRDIMQWEDDGGPPARDERDGFTGPYNPTQSSYAVRVFEQYAKELRERYEHVPDMVQYADQFEPGFWEQREETR